ncbi:MAG: AAA family ATPase [Eubacterium sp.]|nr:AAA family ATPase [Eubacterium sp.]
MAENVLNKVLEKCRDAMFAGMPIVYIKTDSDIFIRKLVMTDKNPLVVLRYSRDDEYKAQDMPIYSLPKIMQKPNYCINYDENSLRKAADFKGPWICTKKMSSSSLSLDAERLEQYVIEHEDENSAQYDNLQSSLIILYSSEVFLSPMLKTYTEIIDLDYPEKLEIRDCLENIIGNRLGNGIERLCSDLQGFTAEEVEVVAQKIHALIELKGDEMNTAEINKMALEVVRGRKKQKLQGGLLEQKSTKGDIGGMGNFKEWLMKQKEPLVKFDDYKEKLGINPPNGVLLCGIPGCGKTLAAKFAAKALGEGEGNDMTLLSMDIGSLMDKYQGESEHKMREALKLAEAMSPCVLLIDEIEKGFSGASSGGDDSSSFKRMFGYMLGWMQDNESPCFIFATSNDISGLPKEFFRSGRFDALYAAFLPTAAECANIFTVCAKEAEKRVKKARKEKKDDFSSSEVDETDILFDSECKKEQMYLSIIDDYLVNSDGTPRIIIGSDIQKAFDIALRELKNSVKNKAISRTEWNSQLRKVLIDKTFTTYGEGEENLDGIVLAYCRMLRKGFIATSDNPLFSADDYSPVRAEKIEELKSEIRICTDPEKAKGLKAELENCTILQKRNDINNLCKYDRAVYECLFTRINTVAAELEKYEKNIMIRR